MKNSNNTIGPVGILSICILSAAVGFLAAIAIFVPGFAGSKSGYLADASDTIGRPTVKSETVILGDKKIVISPDNLIDGAVDFAVNRQVAYSFHYYEKAALIKTNEYEYPPNKLVRDLLKIAGVEKVCLSAYTITIYIAKAFDTGEVEKAALAVITTWLNKPGVLEDESPKPKPQTTSNYRYGGAFIASSNF